MIPKINHSRVHTVVLTFSRSPTSRGDRRVGAMARGRRQLHSLKRKQFKVKVVRIERRRQATARFSVTTSKASRSRRSAVSPPWWCQAHSVSFRETRASQGVHETSSYRDPTERARERPCRHGCRLRAQRGTPACGSAAKSFGRPAGPQNQKQESGAGRSSIKPNNMVSSTTTR